MREILFRGKRIDNGEWVEGSAMIPILGGETCIVVQDAPYHSFVYEVIPETVEQYTGMKDSNSKKVFEGDIIRYADFGDYNMYLESLECPDDYDGVDLSNIWTVDAVDYGTEIGYPAFDLCSHDWECNGLSELSESCQYFYEVIGNIHDNPELLRV